MKAKNQTKLPVLKNALVRQHRIKTVSESRGVHLRQPLQSKLFTFQVPPRALFLFPPQNLCMPGIRADSRAFTA